MLFTESKMPLDSEQAKFHEFGDETFIRVLRVMFGKPFRYDSPPSYGAYTTHRRLDHQTFVPEATGDKTFESLEDISEKAAQWVQETGMILSMMSASVIVYHMS